MRRQGRNVNALTTKETKTTKVRTRATKKNLATRQLPFVHFVSFVVKKSPYFLGVLGG
jgi:hypothetical protein